MAGRYDGTEDVDIAEVFDPATDGFSTVYSFRVALVDLAAVSGGDACGSSCVAPVTVGIDAIPAPISQGPGTLNSDAGRRPPCRRSSLQRPTTRTSRARPPSYTASGL